MTLQDKNPYKPNAIKLCIIALVSLLLLIPLVMVKGVIADRVKTKVDVEAEVANATALEQKVTGPVMCYDVVDPKTSKKISNYLLAKDLDYDASVETETLHRSIYDVVIYNSEIVVKGTFKVSAQLMNNTSCYMFFRISDIKGMQSIPEIDICNSTYEFELDREKIYSQYPVTQEGMFSGYDDNILKAKINLPADIKEGDELEYTMRLKIKGTKSLSFKPYAEESTLYIKSSYPHPSFIGDFLPEKRAVTDSGFSAYWSVLGMNVSNRTDGMGVKFVNPSDPYLQSERTTKYGFLVIVLVFVATILVEFITRKEINIVQYAIVGLSLVLFYSLLISFSEIASFGLAYLVSAVMTTAALMFYFRRMLKNKVAYYVGAFVAVMYGLNYVIIQMETFALLTGSLLLFVMLLVLMYFTANMNSSKNNIE